MDSIIPVMLSFPHHELINSNSGLIIIALNDQSTELGLVAGEFGFAGLMALDYWWVYTRF